MIVCVCFQLDCKNTNITDRCSLCRLLSKRYGSDNMSKSIIETNVKIASFFSLVRIFIFIECTHFILTYFNAMQHKNEKCQNKISKSSHKINESNPLEKRWKKKEMMNEQKPVKIHTIASVKSPLVVLRCLKCCLVVGCWKCGAYSWCWLDAIRNHTELSVGGALKLIAEMMWQKLR